MGKWVWKHQNKGELFDDFPNKGQALDFIEKIHDMGWIDKNTYKCCMVRMGESCDDSEKIDQLGLSVRAYNCLLRANVYTLNQLRYLLLGNRHPQSNQDIFEIRNLGIQTAIEIMERAINYGVVQLEEIGSSPKIFTNSRKWEICRDELLKQGQKR